MRTATEKVKVETNYLSSMQEQGWDLSDNSKNEKEYYAKFGSQEIINQLTAKQRKIVICLGEGMRREEIALHLLISVQEVHQIIARIKRRVEERELSREQKDTLKNLVYLYWYYANCNAKQLYAQWSKDSVLKDYPRPSIITLRKWLKGYQEG